ncbi:lethal malignant brain tumor-like protein 3 isoform x1 [Limosa lapponica baueri]|uniref:Lethal malignant brain tumor-like protein 3 isoform x1 n=1 Tax=Limosa lapponica baueri TaxID=1758121 RepID=A0A2I0T6W3_LIMLA|nr:lethal malignant brain tumor-like protein 3 isoform x1 [Limosa lapponica baueri]
MVMEAKLRAEPGDAEVPWCSRPGSVVAKAVASGCSPWLMPAQRGGLASGEFLPSGFGSLCHEQPPFRVNEFGALEVITDETEMESVKKATATTTWMVPTAQEGETFTPVGKWFGPQLGGLKLQSTAPLFCRSVSRAMIVIKDYSCDEKSVNQQQVLPLDWEMTVTYSKVYNFIPYALVNLKKIMLLLN